MVDGAAASIDADGPTTGDYALLWADVDVCIDQANERAYSLKALASTFTQAAQLEEHHAQNLGLFRKKNPLSQPSKGSARAAQAASSTLDSALVSFGCVFLDNLIKSRVVMAHEYATLGKKLAAFRAEQKKAQKQLLADNTRLDKQLQAQRYILQRSRNKYYKACREAERLIDQRDRTDLQRSTAELVKVQTKAAEQIDACFEAERMHKQVVHETRRTQEKNRAAKEKLVREFQALERVRALRIRSTLARFAQVHIEQAEYMRTLLGDLDKTAGQIEPDRDLVDFVDAHTHGAAPEITYETFDRYVSERLDKNVRERRGSLGLGDVAKLSNTRGSTPPADTSAASSPRQPSGEFTTERTMVSLVPQHSDTPGRDGDAETGSENAGDIAEDDDEETKSDAQEGDEQDLVEASFAFDPIQDDMIALEAGDIVRVLHKDPCGWWTGEKLRDGSCGLFPSNYVAPLSSARPRTLPSAA